MYMCLGEEHNIKFTICACEPIVLTMMRAHLWPSSPQRPHFGFSFEILDWAEALLLEAQISLNDFCKALYFKCHHIMTKVSNVSYKLHRYYKNCLGLCYSLMHMYIFSMCM